MFLRSQLSTPLNQFSDVCFKEQILFNVDNFIVKTEKTIVEKTYCPIITVQDNRAREAKKSRPDLYKLMAPTNFKIYVSFPETKEEYTEEGSLFHEACLKIVKKIMDERK
jgi:hypothetical protein